MDLGTGEVTAPFTRHASHYLKIRNPLAVYSPYIILKCMEFFFFYGSD
jgi:hypothetical protein